jgi:hypothetical protein
MKNKGMSNRVDTDYSDEKGECSWEGHRGGFKNKDNVLFFKQR